MLELRAGNMAGFDFLILKYRKPIIRFTEPEHIHGRCSHNLKLLEQIPDNNTERKALEDDHTALQILIGAGTM